MDVKDSEEKMGAKGRTESRVKLFQEGVPDRT
jgi:hypothetical protein